jgi:hypothetical protein
MDVDSRMATESDSDARGGSRSRSETPTTSPSPSVVSLAPIASSSSFHAPNAEEDDSKV